MSDMQEGAACSLAPTGGDGQADSASAAQGEGVSRRSALGMLGAALVGLPWIGGGLAALGSFVGVPARAFSGATTPDEVPAGLLSDLKEDVPKSITFGDDTVYVILHGGVVKAFSGTCPHAGCLIALPPADPLTSAVPTKHFKCPCHGGTFDFTGKCVAGPPPRGLFEHTVKISMGRVVVGRKKDA